MAKILKTFQAGVRFALALHDLLMGKEWYRSIGTLKRIGVSEILLN